MNDFIPGSMAEAIANAPLDSMATLMTVCDNAPALPPEIQAEADAAHAATMALVTALCRSVLAPGNDTTH
ncbi:hypothetical protein [Pseudomonas sp. Kh13]|uniref:hypothetical protein n=1 Tax=Pseudomonas sp. Kh13 TaxID=2093744 RepID=UPI001183A578|nr:hypothetical protein [Pseudomonas sp. Kh13]